MPLAYSRIPQARPQVDLAADHTDLPFESWLVHAGLLSNSAASGFPVLLPAGQRVAGKLRALLRKRAEEIGFCEMRFPSLYPAGLLEASGRFAGFEDSVYVARHPEREEFLAAPTHEEWAAEFFATTRFAGYLHEKTLPAMVFQIGTLWRDLRSKKKGRKNLLKMNEFELFESYTLCAGEEQLAEVVERVDGFYAAVFADLGLGAIVRFDHRRLAPGEERRTKCYTDHLVPHEKGEYRFFVSPSGQVYATPGLCRCCRLPLAAGAGEGGVRYICAGGHQHGEPGLSYEGDEVLALQRMFTVGMSMRVDDACVRPFGLAYQSAAGERQGVVMGTHGLGLVRLMLAAYQQHHDCRGMAWPRIAAPYDLTVVPRQEEDGAEAWRIAERVRERGIDLIIDDRYRLSPYARVLFSEFLGVPAVLQVGTRDGKPAYAWIARGERQGEVATAESREAVLARLEQF